MILLHHSKRSDFLSWHKLVIFAFLCLSINSYAQKLAAYHDNQGKFYVFDDGKIIEAEYLPVNEFKVGGKCILYLNNRNNLKMYYNGEITTLEVNAPDEFETLDYLSAYSIGGIVKIIDNGRPVTVTTNSIKYDIEDSIVTFYDITKQLLAIYYKGKIQILEDGLSGDTTSQFVLGDNLVAYVSSRTKDFKIFYGGKNRIIEPFLSGGDIKAGRDLVAFINQADQKFKVFYKNNISLLEEFPPDSFQTGDGIIAYVDNTGSFKAFVDGEHIDISSFRPDFFKVQNHMIIYSEQGYFKVWYNNRPITLETYIPGEWKSQWNTIVYRDVNRNVKIFSKGESKVLTYDIAKDIALYRDIVVVNKGMNNHNVYYKGKKY